jgi:tetratricopeptide (TPR) repeat protein
VIEPSPQRLFTGGEVVRLLGLTPRRSSQLRRLGLLKPDGEGYRFRELVGLRVACGLLDRGLTVRQIGRALDDLRRIAPGSEAPLSEVRVVADGQRILVETDRVRFDPRTGQTVMTFNIEELEAQARAGAQRGLIRPLMPHGAAAEAWFSQGSLWDGDPARWEPAVNAYERALIADPTHAPAWNNLGLLHHRMGNFQEAAACYQNALDADPACCQAAFNLGSLQEDLGDGAAAVIWYHRALEISPDYADCHFNLAGALARAGRARDAERHWRRYLELDPDSRWAQIARAHLEEAE